MIRSIKFTQVFSRLLLILLSIPLGVAADGIPLYFWRPYSFQNFGDELSLVIVERIVGAPVESYAECIDKQQKKLLAVGSILLFASTGDVVWGTGLNGKSVNLSHYNFSSLDVRAVRGPITRDFIQENFQIQVPEVYGDPVLLFPYLFPEFKKSRKSQYEYLIIPHYSEIDQFPKSKYPNAVYPTEPWYIIVSKILKSKFVISSSLHGVIVAEAFGIPARLLKISDYEPLLKYQDYYYGTNRPDFKYATSVQEALKMGGEKPFQCDLELLYNAFPFDYWKEGKFYRPRF